MASLKRGERVKDSTTTTGTGTVTLAGAPTGFQAISAALANGDRTIYTIADQGGANWEVGFGTYTSSGTTLSRDQVIASSNSNALVSFAAGTKDVMISLASIEVGAFDAAIYGAGVDGDVSISSGTTTLTRDMYYNNLTITGTTSKIVTAGYRIYVKDKLDISGYTGSGPIFDNSASGTTAATGNSVGAGGASGSGTNPGNGGNGGTGGTGGTSTMAVAGSAGTTTTATNPHSVGVFRHDLMNSVGTKLLGGAGGGNGGTGGNADWVQTLGGKGNGTLNHPVAGGSGGGGGGGGGVVFIAARVVVTGASNPAGSIAANGGTGANGASGAIDSQQGGAGGGGSGGGGGWIFFAYALKVGSVITNLLRCNGGTGGNGGAAAGSAAGGTGGAGGRITLWNLGANSITETTGSAGSAASGGTGGAGNSFGATL